MKGVKILLAGLLFLVFASVAMAKVNINTASKAELESLPRIGPSTAQRIIEYREKYGGFAKIEDLMNIKGIGEKTFEKLRDQITVGDVSKLNIKPYRESKKFAGSATSTQKKSTSRRSSAKSYSGKLNINTATESELDALPGVGPTTAKRIVEYRKENGPFKKIEDIKKVKGIGERSFLKIKDYIKIEGESDFKVIKSGSSRSRSRSSKKPEITGKININTASASELTKLPGIGPKKAQAIVEYRETNGKFKNPHDIVRVKGIGEKTYERLKDYITTE